MYLNIFLTFTGCQNVCTFFMTFTVTGITLSLCILGERCWASDGHDGHHQALWGQACKLPWCWWQCPGGPGSTANTIAGIILYFCYQLEINVIEYPLVKDFAMYPSRWGRPSGSSRRTRAWRPSLSMSLAALSTVPPSPTALSTHARALNFRSRWLWGWRGQMLTTPSKSLPTLDCRSSPLRTWTTLPRKPALPSVKCRHLISAKIA